MTQLPEMLTLVGRWCRVLALVCSLIAIVLTVVILLKENPILALALSLSVIGLVVAIVNLAKMKGGRRRKRTLEIDMTNSFAYDDLELAFHGVTSALALLGDMGYMGGDIYDGLSRAASILDATIKDAQKTKLLGEEREGGAFFGRSTMLCDMESRQKEQGGARTPKKCKP